VVRSDARENRARILEVARRALAEDGQTSTNRIAQLAGVGAGTLYRHFPTREALVLAVYTDEVDALVASVDDLLATEEPLDALRRWTLDLVAAMRRKHGLGDALSPAAHDEVVAHSHDPVLGAIARLLDAGQAAGVVRRDADPADYLALTAAFWRAPAERTEAVVDVVLDGMRARRG
jgi:AcrR family transcriptional regulator